MIDPDKIFTVTMLDVLREPFERWLADHGLILATVPGQDPRSLVVVPRDLPDIP